MTADNQDVGVVRLNVDPRVKVDGSIGFNEFGLIHNWCEVVEEHLGTVNSNGADSASGAGLKSRYHCWTHDVSSAVKIRVGF